MMQNLLLILFSNMFLVAVLYTLRTIFVYKSIGNHFYLALLGWFSSLYVLCQIILIHPIPDQTALIVHKIKLAAVFCDAYAIIAPMYITFLHKKKVPLFYVCIAVPLLFTIPFDVFTSLPVTHLTIDKFGIIFNYRYGTTGIFYTIFAVFFELIFIYTIIYTIFAKIALIKKISIYIMVCPLVAASFNDFLVAHNILNNIMITEYMTFWIFLVQFATIYSYEQRSFRKIKNLNRILDNTVRRRTKELQKTHTILLDSIYYARKIQQSILPGSDFFDNFFRDYLIIFQEKDLVGGDFYWVKERNDDFILAVIDCTGHGVSGALMTMSVNAELANITRDLTGFHPASILEHLDPTSLRLNSDPSFPGGGFDIGMVSWSAREKTLRFAGAYISLVVVEPGGVKEIKGDRCSIGYGETKKPVLFTEHRLKPEKENTYYLFSDGITDQIGGSRGFPFGKTKMYNLLVSIRTLPMSEQRKAILKEFARYKSSFPQVDDITIIGFKM